MSKVISRGDAIPAVIGITGRSGSGKTYLLTQLIPALTARGLKVGAAKHSSHGFQADQPGKDSHRLYGAGAHAVAVVSREQRATFTRVQTEPDAEPSLADALQSLPEGLDLVLVEGFSWEPIPRLVVVPESETPLPHHSEHNMVIGVVHVPKPAPGEDLTIPEQLIDKLARDLAGLAHEWRRTSECTPATYRARA